MVKNLPANAGSAGWIPGLARFPGGQHGNPLQYSCLENPMARGAWQAAVHRDVDSLPGPIMHIFEGVGVGGSRDYLPPIFALKKKKIHPFLLLQSLKTGRE